MYLSVCTNSNILSVISLVKSILEIICTIIPIILMVMITADISKLVINPDDKNQRTVMKLIGGRTIAAIAIFFMPTIINIITSNLGTTNLAEMSCWKNANTETIALYAAQEEEAKRLAAEEIEAAKGSARVERELLAQERERLRQVEEEKSQTVANYIKPYYQKDYPHVQHHPACGTIAACGCGPTSAAVVATAFLGEPGNDPVSAKNEICGVYNACGSYGTGWQGVISYLRGKGLNVSAVSYNDSDAKIINTLKTGKELIIVVVADRGVCSNAFTSLGHFFVLSGVADNGQIEIVEVNSRERTSITWPIREITKCMNGAIYVSKGGA